MLCQDSTQNQVARNPNALQLSGQGPRMTTSEKSDDLRDDTRELQQPASEAVWSSLSPVGCENSAGT